MTAIFIVMKWNVQILSQWYEFCDEMKRGLNSALLQLVWTQVTQQLPGRVPILNCRVKIKSAVGVYQIETSTGQPSLSSQQNTCIGPIFWTQITTFIVKSS